MKKLLVLILLLLFSLSTKAMSDLEELEEIKKSEPAPYSGIIAPFDYIKECERAHSQNEYMIKNPKVCDECLESSAWEPILFGVILGMLGGFSIK